MEPTLRSPVRSWGEPPGSHFDDTSVTTQNPIAAPSPSPFSSLYPVSVSVLQSPPAPPVAVPRADYASGSESDIGWCATWGCIYSFIPVIGWLTAYVNCRAPMSSRRYCVGVVSGIIGSMSAIIGAVVTVAAGRYYGQ